MKFSTTDPLNRTVTLKQSTWDYKICNYYNTNSNGEHGNSHPEMEKLLEIIKSGIENPQFIFQNTRKIMDGDEEKIVPNDTRQEYIKMYFDKDDFGMRIIKTIVEFKDDVGDIVTTFKIEKPKKDIKPLGGIIYDSTNK